MKSLLPKGLGGLGTDMNLGHELRVSCVAEPYLLVELATSIESTDTVAAHIYDSSLFGS